MRRTPLVLTLTLTLTLTASLTACTRTETPQTTTKAQPGHYITLAGNGPDGGPGSIEPPIDLIEAPGNTILFLGESGTVFRLTPDGRVSQYAGGPNLGNPTPPNGPLSIALDANGAVLLAVATSSGVVDLYKLAPGAPPERVASVGKTVNPLSVHLVRTPSDEVWLLKDGWFLQETAPGVFEPVPHPKGLPKSGKVLAAARDGEALLLALSREFVWLQDGKVSRRVHQRGILHETQGASIAPDGKGGAYAANHGAYVDMRLPDGSHGSIMDGHSGRVPCTTMPSSGITGSGDTANLSKAAQLLRREDQLLVADSGCARILAIGLPTKTFSWAD
ncbi:lactonase family protein [Bailinhaonella thermotolerans]|uniref:lactonase family protein n=1 Tax=Bailinhaonella thermotolerans TaxID=1070861 RepID=UPI0011C3FCB3|nr:lactonase family protein [Bailinhaonella thermotolerans]